MNDLPPQMVGEVDQHLRS